MTRRRWTRETGDSCELRGFGGKPYDQPYCASCCAYRPFRRDGRLLFHRWRFFDVIRPVSQLIGELGTVDRVFQIKLERIQIQPPNRARTRPGSGANPTRFRPRPYLLLLPPDDDRAAAIHPDHRTRASTDMAFANLVALPARGHRAPARRCRRRPRMAAPVAPVKEDIRTRLNKLLTVTAPPETEFARARAKTEGGKQYKVMLYNDESNSMEYVSRVLLRCIPGLTEEHAWSIMQKAHKDGMAVVGIWILELAEGYCDLLRNNGIRSDVQRA